VIEEASKEHVCNAAEMVFVLLKSFAESMTSDREEAKFEL
jgi:hypothetical protein